jgi:hypothetical protein
VPAKGRTGKYPGGHLDDRACRGLFAFLADGRVRAEVVFVNRPAKQNAMRGFRAVDPILLEKKVPTNYGNVFVEAGRQNNIDPVVLGAISAHESGGA